MTNTPRRYRLLKDLPNLPANDIFIWSDADDMYKSEQVDGWDKYTYYDKQIVENSDFFAPIIEEQPKEWEIVKLKNKFGGHIMDVEGTKHKDFLWKYYLPHDGEPPSWDIHSVKRLSDNEVFSVGDDKIWQDGSIINIGSFEIGKNGDMLICQAFRTARFNIMYFKMSTTPSQSKEEWSDESVIKIIESYINKKVDEKTFHTIKSFYKQSKSQPQEPAHKISEKEFYKLYDTLKDKVNSEQDSQPEQQSKRIEVHIWQNTRDGRNGHWVGSYASLTVFPKEKIPLIKQAIENVLNDEPQHDLTKGGNVIISYPHYQQLLENGKTFFNAAKERYTNNCTGRIKYFDGGEGPYHPERYKTFDDYLKTIK